MCDRAERLHDGDHHMIESGANGFCVLKVYIEDKEYFLPLVEWPGVFESVRANFYKWVELAKVYTKMHSAIQLANEVFSEGSLL